MKLYGFVQKAWHMPLFKKTILAVAGFIPDKQYVKLLFKYELGYSIDLKHPNTFNEKLNWLKLNNRNPLYTKMVDKFEVKKIVADRIGEQYVVNNIGKWASYNEIDFDKLPNRFVLKCTHDSSGAIVCRDKSTFDFASAEKKICNSMKLNYFYVYREWPYKNVKPLIIADEFLDDHTGKELNDYKFWCFNGEPKYMYCTVKAKEIYENFYDMNFNPVNINHGFKRRVPEFEKPAAFEEMKFLAAKLSEGIPFVRVDFFYVDGKVYFGEFTFFDWGGIRPFATYELDLELGKQLKL